MTSRIFFDHSGTFFSSPKSFPDDFTGEIKAILDRFEENWAVLEIENYNNIVLPKEKISAPAKDGSHLVLTFQDGEVVACEIDAKSTKVAADEIAALVKELELK